ncbi:flagellar protein FliT [Azoarcus indigens]|uniref:Flagellar protein FliT n=1 Tax=Azoarcus indigens TaxID=29545 RepID=A0A4R6DTL3_9RHOO|nr:flagellar protein FliT [Azoarcus indigens]NMG64445.1 flagellar protein FliT [Azoarcus indigens]TDN48383.1 flagellar protein FliT [Azoarcus indigens]
MSALQHFQAMAECAAQMREAAVAHDWDKLTALEKDLAAMRDTARANIDPAGITDAAERETILGLLQQILDDEVTIRSHADPWMESTRKWLAQANRGKAMKNAYSRLDF